MRINREILRLAIPAIITNITVPLLGLVDISIAGHLGDVKFIGAIAIGSMMFNLLYWNFSFLRMGTTGITAQFLGRREEKMITATLYRALFIALSIAAVILICQSVLKNIALMMLSPSEDVSDIAVAYFDICVWGAPALLCTNVMKGWFLGMQNSRYPMIVAISINILNIFLSLIAVFVFKAGFKGIALGTLCAEYFGLLIGAGLMIVKYRKYIVFLPIVEVLKGSGIKRFFSVNSDIFIRSVCLLSVTVVFTSIGARAGDKILAMNAIIMQLFLFYSYFMDGFAFAGEALVGEAAGAGNRDKLRRIVRGLFLWGTSVAIVFVTAYGGALELVLNILTEDDSIIAGILDIRIWCILIPIAGMSAFIWDGIFVGLTATRYMVASIFIAAGSFFAVYYIAGSEFSNNRLWFAFILYLALRGLVLWFFYRKVSVIAKG